MPETERLAQFVTGTAFSDISDAAVEDAKRSIRDYVGVALFGSQHAVGDRLTRYTDRYAPGEQATVFGRGSASAPGAALANGGFGHAVDYDDTFESIVIHPTSPVFPAAFAAAELEGTDGTAVLTGYVLGVETAFRVGHATYPSHYDQGFHATGTIGTFGAAAAAGSVLDLTVDEVRHAFGIAASSSSSLKKNFGSMTKPYHAGHAAEMGLRAALLAGDGFTGDKAILDGPIGYGEVMTPGGDYDPSKITDGLGESWAVGDIGYKPYPSGVITHAAMEVLREIVIDEDLRPEDVEQIIVTLDAAASEMLHHERPEDALQAKFSIEFCLAAVLLERDVTIHEFTDEYVRSEEARSTVTLVDRDFEPNLFGDEFAGYGARVIVRTTDGDEFAGEERRAPGSPSNPLPETRWVEKFETCAGTVLPGDDVESLHRAVDTLEESGSLAALTAAARSA